MVWEQGCNRRTLALLFGSHPVWKAGVAFGACVRTLATCLGGTMG